MEEVFDWVISFDLPLYDLDMPTLLHCSSGSRSSCDISIAPSSLAHGRCFKTWVLTTCQFYKLSFFLWSSTPTNVFLPSIFGKLVGIALPLLQLSLSFCGEILLSLSSVTALFTFMAQRHKQWNTYCNAYCSKHLALVTIWALLTTPQRNAWNCGNQPSEDTIQTDFYGIECVQNFVLFGRIKCQPEARWSSEVEEAVSKNRSDENCRAYISASWHASSVIIKAKAEAWQADLLSSFSLSKICVFSRLFCLWLLFLTFLLL